AARRVPQRAARDRNSSIAAKAVRLAFVTEVLAASSMKTAREYAPAVGACRTHTAAACPHATATATVWGPADAFASRTQDVGPEDSASVAAARTATAREGRLDAV